MKLSDQKGQALVELAIILPLLVLLVFGAFEFGRAMYIKNTLNYAAREGARRASTCDPFNITTVQDYVSNSVPVSLQAGLVTSVTPVAPQHGITTVTVVVTRPFATVVPDLLTQLAGITTLSAQASMRYE